MAGYSKTPLVKKLGLKSGMRAVVLNAPSHYTALLALEPEDVLWTDDIKATPNFVHLFTDSRAILAETLADLRNKIAPDGMVWVSWPKKASKVRTDVTEDTIREVCLPLGFVDVKVCAVDDVWSGLKFVIRKELR